MSQNMDRPTLARRPIDLSPRDGRGGLRLAGLALAAAALGLLGCASSNTRATPADSAGRDAAADAANLLAARPYEIHVPPSYDGTTATPLVVMLHGYGATGVSQESYYFRLTATSDAKGFLYAYPEGTVGTVSWSAGAQFWNATDACCDFFALGPDDVAYFDVVLADIAARYNLDAKRVFVVGHSNGGFMAHRLACDRSAKIAAVVSVAGAQWNDPTRCQPSGPVSVVEMHGDHDVTVGSDYGIDYNGGSTSEGPFPSAHQTVATWAQKNGCTGALAAAGPALDLIPGLPDAETRVEGYGGCPAGVDVQLWTVQGGGHMDPLDATAFGESMWSFMAAHARR
jgi:polyhydroxybutyrate depolymerase